MANQWYLKTQDEVFGPVTRDSLLEWAQMGRIQPGQDISEDGENWVPATEIAFLDMRWSIDIGDGTPRGPFNKRAAQALLASGRLPKGSRLVEVTPPPVETAQTPEEPSRPAPSPRTTSGAASAGPDAPVPAVPANAAEIETLKRQIETLQAGLKAAEARAAEAERRAATARTEAKTALKAADVAEARLASVQAEISRKEADCSALRQEADQVRQDADAKLTAAKNLAEQQLAQVKEQASQQLSQAKALADRQLMQAKEQAGQARKELEEAQREADAALAARDDALAQKDSQLEQKESALAEKAAQLAARESALAEKARALTEAERLAREASAKADAAESDLADLFSVSQANEAAYEDRIRTLSDEIKRLPPTAHLAADAQAAMYMLMKEEADELAAALEAETKELEAMRQYRIRRTERLLARRQEILRRLGTDAEDMTKRALKAHPEDPRTVHMRQELDALRVLQERSALESERKIRDLSTRLRESEGEANRLRAQVADVGTVYRQLQETRERLMRRERELVEERQRSEAERQHNQAAQQALLTRLSALEMGMPGATHQSREARNVRLAPWMGLKQ